MNLNKHIYAFHRCDSCEKLFFREDNLRKHIRAVHKVQKARKCNSSEKSFFANKDLIRHNRSFHQGCKSYKCICDFCGIDCSFIQLILYRSCENRSKSMKCEIGLFERPEWPSSCIFFSRVKRVKKYATRRPFWP